MIFSFSGSCASDSSPTCNDTSLWIWPVVSVIGLVTFQSLWQLWSIYNDLKVLALCLHKRRNSISKVTCCCNHCKSEVRSCDGDCILANGVLGRSAKMFANLDIILLLGWTYLRLELMFYSKGGAVIQTVQMLREKFSILSNCFSEASRNRHLLFVPFCHP